MINDNGFKFSAFGRSDSPKTNASAWNNIEPGDMLIASNIDSQTCKKWVRPVLFLGEADVKRCFMTTEGPVWLFKYDIGQFNVVSSFKDTEGVE